MDLLSRIYRVLGEITYLAHMLFTDGVRFIALCARSRTALAAENLFLRKQLAFYLERNAIPRRFDNVTRFILVLLSRAFAWKDALVNVTPSLAAYRTQVHAQMPAGTTACRSTLVNLRG